MSFSIMQGWVFQHIHIWQETIESFSLSHSRHELLGFKAVYILILSDIMLCKTLKPPIIYLLLHSFKKLLEGHSKLLWIFGSFCLLLCQDDPTNSRSTFVHGYFHQFWHDIQHYIQTQTMTESPLCFTDGCRHSLLYLPPDLLSNYWWWFKLRVSNLD